VKCGIRLYRDGNKLIFVTGEYNLDYSKVILRDLDFGGKSRESSRNLIGLSCTGARLGFRGWGGWEGKRKGEIDESRKYLV